MKVFARQSTMVYPCGVSPKENIDFVLTFPVVLIKSFLPYLDGLWNGGSHFPFSLSVMLESRWCINAVLLTRPQLEGSHVWFYQRSPFHMIDNQSCLCRLDIYVDITTETDEILLPRYGIKSIKFRGLPFHEEIALSSLKHVNSGGYFAFT